MFSFMASQAVALSQAKQNASKAPASGKQSAAPRTGKGFFSRLFDAMANARMRRAEVELRYHRGLHEESPKK